MGVILSELLTGRPPFQESNDLQTLHAVAWSEPARPRRLKAKLPRDLEAITLKCLEKRPCQRYVRAADLAQDLWRFLSGQPTDARPAGTAKRAWKWARRRPAAAALMIVLTLSLMTMLCGGVWHAMTLHEAVQATALLEHQTQRHQRLARRRDYAVWVQEAYYAWENADVASALALLDHCRPGPGEEDLRGFEWYYVERGAVPSGWNLRTSPRALRFPGFRTPVGRRVMF